MKNFSFVFGNGTSRLKIQQDLRDYGEVYVCNRAAYDIPHHFCIAVDKGISQELQENNFVVYTREGNRLSDLSKILPVNTGWSSGPAAASLAAYRNSKYIFLLGMDLKSSTEKINNVYAGTKHYSPADSTATPYTNWISQISELMLSYSNVRFIHVNPLQGFTPESWIQKSNCDVLNLDDFHSMINNTTVK